MCLYDVHTDKIVNLRAENKKLKAENDKLLRTMRLHAGDCCSLNNEVELFRGHWEDAERSCKLAEERCKELQAKLLLSESQNYCKICGNILDGYKPNRP